MTDLIIIAESSDDITSAGVKLIKFINNNNNNHKLCLENSANSNTVERIVNQLPNVPIFFTGHGSAGQWNGTDNKPIICSKKTDLKKYSERTIFALACMTGCHLGPNLAMNGSVYIGYNKKVSSIPLKSATNKIVAEFLSNLFELIKKFSHSNNTQAFENGMMALGRRTQRKLFKFIQHPAIYSPVAIAIQEWTDYFLIVKTNYHQAPRHQPLDMLRNESLCVTACTEEGLLFSYP